MSNRRVVVYGWSHRVHVQRWVRGMKSRGFDMRLISLDGDLLEDIETIVLPRYGKESYLSHIGKIRTLTRAIDPVLVHAHYAAGFGMWAWLSGFHPSLVSVWGADVIDFPSNPFKRWMVRKILRSADAISATSRLLKEHVLSLAGDCEEKTTIIPFGVELSESVAAMPTGPVKLCFIKAHQPKYGPDVLLRAFAQAMQTVPSLSLSMAGEGDMTDRLKKLADELGIAGSVSFVGFVPNEQIFDFVAQHHIMVMPSVMQSESFGVAVLEASASGRPTIASRIGGVPEVLEDGVNGLLVEPNSVEHLAAAIVELANDRDRCVAMGQRGRKLVRDRYTWTKSLDMMAELYERLIHDQKKA